MPRLWLSGASVVLFHDYLTISKFYDVPNYNVAYCHSCYMLCRFHCLHNPDVSVKKETRPEQKEENTRDLRQLSNVLVFFSRESSRFLTIVTALSQSPRTVVRPRSSHKKEQVVTSCFKR